MKNARIGIGILLVNKSLQRPTLDLAGIANTSPDTFLKKFVIFLETLKLILKHTPKNEG
jgi:hypothetical protein